jgi:hypothetical protein
MPGTFLFSLTRGKSVCYNRYRKQPPLSPFFKGEFSGVIFLKGEFQYLMVDLVSIISKCKRFYRCYNHGKK